MSEKLNCAIESLCVNNDESSFVVIFMHFSPKLFLYNMRYVRDACVARDIAQEALFSVWKKHSLFNANKGSFSSWIYTISKNLCIDFIRKNKRNPISEAFLFNEFSSSYNLDHIPLSLFENSVSKEKLWSFVYSLPKSQSDVVRMFYLYDMTQNQIADFLQIPLSTVKSRLRLAVAKLERNLG